MLFGQQDILHEIIEQFPLLTTDQVSIPMHQKLLEWMKNQLQVSKGKKNSSMSLALQSLKEGEADTASCGNTGCLMAGSAIKLRTLEGVERPALCTILAWQREVFYATRCRCKPARETVSYSTECGSWI